MSVDTVENETIETAAKMQGALTKPQMCKDKRITIRIFSEDLIKLRQLAEEEGLAYQTFITSMLHKIATGRLIDKKYL